MGVGNDTLYGDGWIFFLISLRSWSSDPYQDNIANFEEFDYGRGELTTHGREFKPS